MKTRKWKNIHKNIQTHGYLQIHTFVIVQRVYILTKSTTQKEMETDKFMLTLRQIDRQIGNNFYVCLLSLFLSVCLSLSVCLPVSVCLSVCAPPSCLSLSLSDSLCLCQSLHPLLLHASRQECRLQLHACLTDAMLSAMMVMDWHSDTISPK